MNRRQVCATIGGVALLPTVASGEAIGAAVSGDTVPSGSFEIVAQFFGPGPSGISVIPDGRTFVGFPRHAEDHKGPTLAELKEGRLLPYPNAAMSLPSPAMPADRLLSIHGLTVDTRGRLWAIDDGKIVGRPIANSAAKIIGVDPTTDTVIAKIELKPPAMLPESHMNDLRVDLTHGAEGTTYVADSSFGTAPALVVVDNATGRQRRVLTNHVSTRAEEGFLTVLEGRPLRYDPIHPTFPVGGIDGITLSADSSRLYYSPLTSRQLYSIATALVSNFDASDEEIDAGVVDEGEKGMADGLATDRQNCIYITAGEHDAILRRRPSGTMDVVVRDPRIVWPDGIFATDTHVYSTLGQWNRLPGFNGGKDLRQPPYLLIRVPINPSLDVDRL